MESSYNLIFTICPEKDKKIDGCDKYSKYVIRVYASVDLSESLFEYAEYFFDAAHKITEFILCEERLDIGKLDNYFFSIAFLYRHCLELGLKAIGFQYIQNQNERKEFVGKIRHNLLVILSEIETKVSSLRLETEMEWLRKYFADLLER